MQVSTGNDTIYIYARDLEEEDDAGRERPPTRKLFRTYNLTLVTRVFVQYSVYNACATPIFVSDSPQVNNPMQTLAPDWLDDFKRKVGPENALLHILRPNHQRTYCRGFERQAAAAAEGMISGVVSRPLKISIFCMVTRQLLRQYVAKIDLVMPGSFTAASFYCPPV
jgi:hypothetical protein